MDLWLLRHAEAEERSASGRDEDRALTPDGAERARAIARGLAALEPAISLVLTSPLQRARETAEPAAAALRLGKRLRESRVLAPGRDPEEILEELDSEEADGVLLVGHMPHLGALLGRLVSGEADLEIPLKKASVARVAMEARRRGSLRALLPARVLERIGERSR